MVEPLYLAKLNGRAWARRLMPRLRKSVEYFFLMLQPDGYLSLVSDSDRVGSPYLAGLSVLLNEPRWLRFSKPGLREVLMFGKKPADRKLPRPNILAFRESGYYVMRSGDKPGDLQIVFDCGHRGGFHGHFDLLSFELTGFGKSLICDPGRLTYNREPDRQWIISTPAHNTISIDGLNHEHFENVHDRHVKVTEWKVRKDYVQISAQHRGYAKLAGKPVVGRTLRYDRKNTLILRDWGTSSAEHEFTISFTVPVESLGNISFQPHLQPGQKLKREKIFWSPNYGQKEPAVRFTVSQRARRACFITKIVAYSGRKPPAP